MKNDKKTRIVNYDNIIIVVLFLILFVIGIFVIKGNINTNNGRDNAGRTGEGTRAPTPTKAPNIIVDENAGTWDGTNQTQFGDTEEEYTTFPGFYSVIVDEAHQEINLFNYPENTVYFVYMITEETDVQTEISFSTKVQADAYIRTNSHTYEPFCNGETFGFRDEEGNITKAREDYSIQIKDGNFLVVKTTTTMVYHTNGIPPESSVKWNVYNSFEKGSHSVDMIIRAYDIATMQECPGVNNSVDILVN